MARTYMSTSGVPVAWRDSKRYLWVMGLIIPVAPLVGLALHGATGMGVWLWLLPILYYGIIPLTDLIAGYDNVMSFASKRGVRRSWPRGRPLASSIEKVMVNPVEWWDPHWLEDRVFRKIREAGGNAPTLK